MITIPTYDLSRFVERHVVIAAGDEEAYQGHPTTVLLADGRTMIAVWTYGHGGPCGPMKRSEDQGLTWSGLWPVPASWSQVRNCPSIYRLSDKEGRERLFVFAGGGSMYQSFSEDGGLTWSDMEPNGIACVMPWCSIIPVDQGRRLLAQTNARRPGDPDRWSNLIIQSYSEDGGFTWTTPEVVLDRPGYKPCEPALVRSPGGGQILSLMRENSRRGNSWAMVSDDEGRSWSPPFEVRHSLTGDRHVARYAPDGRLVIAFRDQAEGSPTRHHFVAWIGTYDDIVERREGAYRVKLLHSYAGADCGYPGLEVLPDGTFVATTYIKYAPGSKMHSVVSTRFRLDELDGGRIPLVEG